MKLFRFGEFEKEKPGIITAAGKKIDVSSFGEDFNEHFFATDGLNRLSAWLKTNESRCAEVSDSIRLGSCVARPSKIICVGLNYLKQCRGGTFRERPQHLVTDVVSVAVVDVLE